MTTITQALQQHCWIVLYDLRTIKSFFHSAITTSIWLFCVFSGSSVTARHNELVD